MDKDYKTTNFHLSAFLLAKIKNNFLGVNFITSNKAEFIFTSSSRLGELVDKFHSRKTKINLWDFIEAQKFLKSSIYDR
ncbi:hypothetical protein KAJ89_04375 [Candidatus Parcubacteria bacterium]|nr:hypothetical protein [Candidatus Parcubacteria bacterium]